MPITAPIKSDHNDRNYRQIDLGALEAHLQRQAVDPAVAAGAAHRYRDAAADAQDGAQPFPEHQRADGREQHDVGQRNHQVELAERAQQREGPDAERGAEGAAAEQHQRQRRIDGAAAPVGNGAGKRGGRDVAGDGSDRDRGRDPDEDQQRRHQKSAADAEHAGHKTNGRAHRKDEKNIDRNVGDRKVKLHARPLRILP
jgi:hypothetical protein